MIEYIAILLKHTLFISVIGLFFACGEKSDTEKSLELAGNNRSELERVIQYYSTNRDDSLKLKAATFLIANMRAHYSYKDTLSFSHYYDEIDSVAKLHYVNDSYAYVRDKYSKISLNTISDLKCMTAEYLISNIENSFDVWQNSNWAKHVDFNDFCEYILPYKVAEYQTFDHWKEYFFGYAKEPLNNLQYSDLFKYSSYKACETVFHEIRNKTSILISPGANIIPIRRMKTLATMPQGSCDDYTILCTAIMRAEGIPVAIDFTPQWPNRRFGHSWNVLLNNWGKHTTFDISEERPGLPHKEDHKFGKIFRKTYAINKELTELCKKEKFVPEVFQDLCIKDVTDDYIRTQNVRLELSEYKNSQYGYLAVFDNEKWIPIFWGKINNSKVEFSKMGTEVIYLPVCCGSNGLFAVSDPFRLTNKGEIQVLRPDTFGKQTLVLHRKHPYLYRSIDSNLRIVGGQIQASDDKNFTDYETFYTIEEATTHYEEIAINPDRNKYRYWRYYSPDNSLCNIAELAFFEADSTLPMKGEVIGTKGSFFNNPNTTIYAAFDNNPLTFFDAPLGSGCWLGMDFGKKVSINKIRYLPRGDGNCIEPGDEYELVYWYNKSWKSLGRKKADHIFIKFEDCPLNALFLLHNHTKGMEERIFTYENGKQVWW